ncbi:C13 family peptidase [Pseudomonas sp. Ga0074129]|uniref:C13 family peptidase n=1 Tax=Pseudomonas sp. Ga0074129 TaxID=1752219 RepID=UPI000AC30389|nr:C13 family peptidase [Pseudomonas sp. Ga0074129]
MLRLSHLAPLSLALFLAACGDAEPLLPPDAVLPDGSRYRGEVINGLLQGQGRLDYGDGSHYQGQFKDGQFNGQGIYTYADGSRYEGHFVKGLPSGEGHLSSSDFDYRGEFRQGQYNGLGVLQWRSGDGFQGQFRRGEPHGQGVMTDTEGNVFTGSFDNNQLNGLGSFKSADGDLYSGEFRDNQFHGKGRYQSANGDVWSGRFREGSLSGKGQLTGTDASHYQGQFRDWRYHGEGRLSQADGSVYQGQFSYGKYHGDGSLTLADASVQRGTWQHGRLIRDGEGKVIADALAEGLLEQGRLLDEAIAQLPASTPAIELYAMTVAGDGKQSVFMREADYVGNLLQTRFAAHGRLTLINHRDHLATRPMATSASLGRSFQALAERSGAEDLIFIYLTSHGSAQHELHIDQPRLQLADLPASELASLLTPLKDRYKVLVISACYSGGFIPELQDEKTLVITAARADRVSFGCSEENDFTYFGRALFAEALQETDDLQRAFELAKASVAAREKSDGFEPSEPQIWPAKAVLAQWQTWRAEQAQTAPADSPPTADTP